MLVEYRDTDTGKIIRVPIPDDTPPKLLKEVLDYLDENYRRYRALVERERYHRACSLDALDYESAAFACNETPESIMIREEEQGSPRGGPPALPLCDSRAGIRSARQWHSCGNCALPNGYPRRRKPSWERRSSGVSELSRLRGSESIRSLRRRATGSGRDAIPFTQGGLKRARRTSRGGCCIRRRGVVCYGQHGKRRMTP